jgi:hypothetical protein
MDTACELSAIGRKFTYQCIAIVEAETVDCTAAILDAMQVSKLIG